MKPLERKFFRYCCKNLEHTREDKGVLYFREEYNFARLVYEFSEKYNVSTKQLISYIWKWESKGIIEWGVNILYGWFEFDKTGYNIIQYITAIPSRIISHNATLRRQLNNHNQKRAESVKRLLYSVRGIIR